MDVANLRPQRRQQLFASTVRGRFVVLDPAERTLVELHRDVAGLWPLLDGRLTSAEIARRWAVTADASDAQALRIVDAVLAELAATALLDTADD